MGSISKIGGVHVSAGRCRLSAYYRHHNIAEALEVLPGRVVCQVHIGQKQHRIAVLALLFQHKVVNLFFIGVQVQRLPEFGTQTVQGTDDVARWRYNEHSPVALVGVDAVAPVTVGQHYCAPVRNRHTVDRLPVTNHASDNVAAQGNGAAQAERRREYYLFHFLGLPSMQIIVETRPPMGHHQLHAM